MDVLAPDQSFFVRLSYSGVDLVSIERPQWPDKLILMQQLGGIMSKGDAAVL